MITTYLGVRSSLVRETNTALYPAWDTTFKASLRSARLCALIINVVLSSTLFLLVLERARSNVAPISELFAFLVFSAITVRVFAVL